MIRGELNVAYNGQLLNGMVIFSEVVKSGSFTQAAEVSGHSTSYISKEINKLEERLGVRLMNRTTRSLNLTPEGRLYYEQCAQIISEAEQIENALAGHQVEPQGLLRISCPTSLGISRLQPLFADFMVRYPQVDLEVDLNDRKVDLIADGFDVLVRASAQLEDSSLISRKIMCSEGVTIAAPSYLEKHGTPTHPSELVNHQCITYSNLPNPNQWVFVDKQGNEEIVFVPEKFQTNSSSLEVAMCKAGLGITRLPKFIFGNELETGELVELFTDYERIKIDVFTIYPSRKHMSSKVRAFIDFIANQLATD